MIIRLLIISLMAFPGTAMATETPWQDVAPQAKMRVVTGQNLLDGKPVIALELRMPQSLKTYWRVPGETGIPTQITVTDNSATVSANIIWPLPMREVDGGFVDNVYRGDLILPITLPDGSPTDLTINVLMGICSEVCVPVMADFNLENWQVEKDPGNSLRIRQALAQTPLSLPVDDPIIGAVTFDAENHMLQVSYDSQRVDPTALFVSSPDVTLTFGMPEPGSRPDMIQMELLGRTDIEKLRSARLVLTFQTPDGPYEIEREPAFIP